MADCIDQCPSDPNKVFIGACGCGRVDIDSDGDGMPDCLDMCPQSPDITQPGPCGCDMTDTDDDGVLDCVDQCVNDASKSTEGLCGCNVADVDSDGDGIPDCFDSCPGQSDIANEGLAVQFNVPLSGPGGEFRLCWCAAGFDCSSQSSFLVDFGVLEIFGPSPLNQDRTCIAGQTCQLESLLGPVSISTSTLNMYVSILSTCGTRASVEGLPQGGLLSSNLTDTDSSVLGFGSLRTATEGGEYRLCWCGFDQDCSQPSQFRVDVGRFWVIGPSPLQQAWTCINGQTCNINTLTGVGLGDDMVAVMDTCLQNNFHRFPWTVLPMVASHSGASYEFQPAGMTSGQYRMCWCATGMACITLENFALDIGTLNLLGPMPVQQHRTCVSGQPCHFERFSNFGMSGLGTIWILDTCGATGNPEERMPNTGLLAARSPRSLAGCDAAAQDADQDGIPNYLDQCPFHFDQNATGSCGCGADETDLDGDGMPDCLDSCPLDASKVSPGQCGCGTSEIDSDTDGLPDCIDLCPSDPLKTLPGLCGCGLSDSDDADADGVPDCYDKCPAQDQTAPSCGCTAANLDDDGDGTKNCFDSCPNDPGKTLAGVCGCGIPDIDSDGDGHMDCVDGCPLDAAKTSPGQCGCGAADSDADSDLIADCIDQCPTDATKSLLGPCGCGVPDTDSDHDGIPDCYDQCPGFDIRPEVEESFYSFDGDLSAAGGLYRLCWCHGDGDCHGKEDFSVDVGTFEVVGPSPLKQHRTCVSGRVCRMGALEGQHLAAGDQVLVLDTCHIHAMPNTMLVQDNFSVPDTPHFKSELARYNGTEISMLASDVLKLQGGSYRLCWCAGAFDCSTPSRFGVDVGTLTVVGPTSFSQHSTCIVGQTCTLSQISGYWFGSGDNVLLLETCGVAEVQESQQTDIAARSVLEATSHTGESTLFARFAASTAAGGIYRLCWCASVAGGNTPENCASDMGSMVLLGPRPLQQDRTCVVGAECVLEGFTGLGIGHLSQSLLVLDTCGVQHSVLVEGRNSWSSQSSSFATSGYKPSGGGYRLCWCSERCSEMSDFAVDMGQLQMIGPTRLRQQHRTCIAGQRCAFSIEGWYLESTDGYLILDTCGEALNIQSPGSSQFTIDRFFQPDLTTPLSFAKVSSTLTSAGGVYHICWCASSLGCQEISRFDVDVGQLQVIGPIYDQHRTCIAGQTCLLDALLGTDLSTSDRYYILDTCGLPSPPSGFAGAQTADVNSSQSSGSEASVSWNVRISAAGGTYRICWCAGGQVCSAAEDFEVDMGLLTLIGPHRLDHVATCISGNACVVTGISGKLLNSQDKAVLLDTCGSSQPVPGLNSFPREGYPSLSYGATRLELGRGNPATIVTSAGGEYRICWCADGFDCLPSDFIDVGQLNLIGPRLDQDRTCVTGIGNSSRRVHGRCCTQTIRHMNQMM